MSFFNALFSDFFALERLLLLIIFSYVKILIISLFITLHKLHSSPCCFPYLLLVPWLTFLVTPPTQVHAGVERQHAAFIGASVVAKLPLFEELCVFKEDWDENGPEALEKWLTL